jgi:NitT/TauT family transport system ATP-binding protein
VTPSAGIAVELSGVRRAFAGGVTALDGVDLACAPGEFVALLGPSGCGKSTLLRIVAGLETADAGTVKKDGAEVAFVFQDAHLLPWRDVRENVALPLELAGLGPAERRVRAEEALGLVGLGDSAGRMPAELSGGMRMRASLARAMAVRPRLLLLDEPFAALDELSRQRLDDELRRLWRERGMTVLFVTHAVEEAAYLAERAVVFTRRPARVVIDHRLSLPAERQMALRTEASFQGQVRTLRDALERGAA